MPFQRISEIVNENLTCGLPVSQIKSEKGSSSAAVATSPGFYASFRLKPAFHSMETMIFLQG